MLATRDRHYILWLDRLMQQSLLKGVNPALDFLIGRALRRDEQAATLARGVSQRAILTPARLSGVPGWIFSSKAPKKCMDVSPFALGKFCV